ncbi:MAG TPA: bifunctional UDP-N-acetylglucosamine diphosphorylase/glucosamine-1-phosphate N-acetyltransferase GlmU [Candidatus Omnitrophica bacterium]|nr:MAG: hypothetical protein A2Z81_04950 [Omnitrophica WOR_2 bacterium GWA2_45_18]OGX18397.1 MAG: hypothetical protein A2Y04_03950 [Omnitrophica WOR_2 bacterium GWC2_45_7]HBR14875.1 bifunctional UDP-N-acetylglucosamine diphosphorylase/glucosamine-1-phosphate N-acetyltransferase GlmU [Candidatus Omnitrophota bacterium]
MKDLRTIILAAGKGTRMKSAVPKVLQTVCGRPIIQYVLDIAKNVGSLKTYIVVGHKSDDVKIYLPKEVVTVEQKRLLGTADAVKCVEGHLKNDKGDVLILCGDTPLLNKRVIAELIRKHRRTKAIVSFLTAIVDQPKGYGRILRDQAGRAVAILEEKDASVQQRAINEINVGVYCFNSAALFGALRSIKINPKKQEFYLTDIIELFSKRGRRIETLRTENPAEGLGVNTREDLAVAERILRRKILKKLMLSGVTIIDPQTTYIDADVKIGRDTIIRPCTFIENDIRIGKNCKIGPFARLRPGVRIGDEVEIGNFTEVSRTKIGKQTLMKHFSYLGDSLVGSKVNIGAGTITANFDGQKKNQTIIKDQAFIGSDSILIAPVKVGKKAIVGAGSVVTKGKIIPDGSIVVGVPARVIARRKF